VTDRSEEILGLCQRWVEAVTPAEGGLAITDESDNLRLRNNGIHFHELSYPELRAACLGLTQVLLRPGLNTVIDPDHQWFWAWCGELFAGPFETHFREEGTYFSEEEREIKDLFGLACRAALAEGSEEMELNAFELTVHGTVVLVYLALPLLEAIVKKKCASYVAYDGKVRAPFPRGRNGSYSADQRCSSVKDLLWLLHDEVAGPELREGLDFFREHLSELDTNKDPFALLYEWRNSSLHGSGLLPTIGGTVFNLAILVALDGIEEEYANYRHDRIRSRGTTEENRGRAHPPG
jgi:hypothetical protein